MTSAPLKSHLMCSGLPQGSRCRGARVLGASRVGGKVRGSGCKVEAAIPQVGLMKGS